MAIKTAAELKAYFETGDKPTQAQFEDLIDTLFSAIPDYKIYRALLTQTGTDAPVNTELGANTLGVVAFSYNAPGNFTCSSSGLFVEGKTFIRIQNGIDDSDSSNTSLVSAIHVDSSTINILTDGSASGLGVLDNNCLYKTSFEIIVFN